MIFGKLWDITAGQRTMKSEQLALNTLGQEISSGVCLRASRVTMIFMGLQGIQSHD